MERIWRKKVRLMADIIHWGISVQSTVKIYFQGPQTPSFPLELCAFSGEVYVEMCARFSPRCYECLHFV